jgi:hypothetical protein
LLRVSLEVLPSWLKPVSGIFSPDSLKQFHLFVLGRDKALGKMNNLLFLMRLYEITDVMKLRPYLEIVGPSQHLSNEIRKRNI